MAKLPQLKATVPDMLKAPIKQTIAHKALATTFEPVPVCVGHSAAFSLMELSEIWLVKK